MATTESLREAIAAIPFIDHHVHQPYTGPHQLDAAAFRRPFTEAGLPTVWTERLPSHISYRWLVRELAALLDVAPDEAAVLAARNAWSAPDYHRLLADDAKLAAAYADDLFAFGECYDLADWAALLGRPVYRLLRIEVFVQHGFAECPTLDDALARLTRAIVDAPSSNIVGLKSVAGYRTGLSIAPPSGEQRLRAEAAYQRVRETALAGGSDRIANRDLVDTLVWTALEAAVPLRLPLQFHVAFGDDDIVLTRNDPTLLRALFTHAPFRDVPLVLLHCYPYHRQAGYLASLYPNVYVDLGLTIPLVGPGAARVLAETLELAPAAQVLASTDGHMIPEFQWFGVHVWRWALARALGYYQEWGILDEDEALGTARAILHDNATRLYPLAQGGRGTRAG